MENETAIVQVGASSIEPTHHLVALNAAEMEAAKSGMQEFLRRKLAEIEAEIAMAEAQVDRAKQYKLKASTFAGILQRQKSKHLYYGKLLAASEAGYVIVPDMPVDVFAIRVKRLEPAAKSVTETGQTYKPHPNVADETEQRLSVGDGRYESPVQLQTIDRREEKDAVTGKVIKHIATATATGWCSIEFPLAVAHPVVMDAVQHAMALKIFDRIGMVSRGSGDPIILGQITRKEGWSTRIASFLIAWYLDPRTL